MIVINKKVLTISETVKRAKAEGYPISEYTLRRALRSGAIPCRNIGKKYLILWDNVVRWLSCEDGQDNPPENVKTEYGGIRRVEARGGIDSE